MVTVYGLLAALEALTRALDDYIHLLEYCPEEVARRLVALAAEKETSP